MRQIVKCMAALLFTGFSASAQSVPTITSVYTFALHDEAYGPGTEVVILGTFVPQSAGRDYTITVGGQTTGINVAANGVFILATIPPNASPGPTNLIITYHGQASNALPVKIAANAPEFTGGPVTVAGPEVPPQFGPYLPFSDANSGNNISPTAPASPNEILKATVFGVGSNVPPAVTPTVTVAGEKAQVVQTQSNGPGSVTIYFVVPKNAPAGINPVVATIAGVASNTASLPVGTAPAVGLVLNGASFRSSGTVAAGSIVSVFGAGFGTKNNLSAFPSTTVEGLSVTFGATAAPIFALAATGGQINVLVPDELDSSGTVDLTVHDAGGVSKPQTLNLAPAAPGIFFYADPLVPTRRNAVALKANTAWVAMPLSLAGTLGLLTNCSQLSSESACGQPASPGDYLQIYVTGLGKATPNGSASGSVLPTGSVAPASGNPLYETVEKPTVTIGGKPAKVLFSGIAPGYAGLYQVDVQIPANVSTGNDVPVEITIGGKSDLATIAVQ